MVARPDFSYEKIFGGLLLQNLFLYAIIATDLIRSMSTRKNFAFGKGKIVGFNGKSFLSVEQVERVVLPIYIDVLLSQLAANCEATQ